MRDRKQRVNRELTELLNELRVRCRDAGVCRFLLSVPFQQRFTVNAFERDVYFTTLLACALSVVLLVAPAAQHRLLFRKQDEGPMLFRFNRYSIGGLLLLGVALSGALLLVTSYLFGTGGAVAATATTVLLIVLWPLVDGIPLRRRDAERDRAEQQGRLTSLRPEALDGWQGGAAAAETHPDGRRARTTKVAEAKAPPPA